LLLLFGPLGHPVGAINLNPNTDPNLIAVQQPLSLAAAH